MGDVDYLIQYKNKFSATVPLGNSKIPYVAIVLNSVYEYAATVNYGGGLNMKTASKLFAILICLTLTLGVCVLPLSAENNAQLHDDMTDWSKVSAHTENWDMFASHAETGLSVIGRKKRDRRKLGYIYGEKRRHI